MPYVIGMFQCTVLIVIYEDMVQDMSATIQQRGQFMNIIDNNNNDNNNNNKTHLLMKRITRMDDYQIIHGELYIEIR